MEPEEILVDEGLTAEEKVPLEAIRRKYNREGRPISDEEAKDFWYSLRPEDKSVFWAEEVEWRKRAEEEEKEESGQKARFEEYIETGRDPLELKKLEETQAKEEQERKYDRLLSEAIALGIPQARIPSIENMDILEDLIKREKARQKPIPMAKSRGTTIKIGGGGGGISGGISKMRNLVGVPMKSKERTQLYFGSPGLGLYGAPGLRIMPTRKELGKVDIGGPLRQGLNLSALRNPQLGTFKSPLAELVRPPSPIGRPQPSRPGLGMPTREEMPTRELQGYMAQRGYEPVASLKGVPAYFWIGTKKGAEPSSNAWVVRLSTGRYGLAGIGDITRKPRSKISWSTLEEAFDAAGDIPGRKNY